MSMIVELFPWFLPTCSVPGPPLRKGQPNCQGGPTVDGCLFFFSATPFQKPWNYDLSCECQPTMVSHGFNLEQVRKSTAFQHNSSEGNLLGPHSRRDLVFDRNS